MERESASPDTYVFVPLVNNIKYEYSNSSFAVSKDDTILTINNLNKGKHISTIDEKSRNDKKYVEIHNILVLTGYAIDENSLSLVTTLDPCDYVRGILINGEIQQQPQQQLFTITLSKDEVMNKLYFIRKSEVNFQNDIEISIMVKTVKVGKTKYNSLKIEDDKIMGIVNLYGISDMNAIDDLKRN
ncbi:type III-B CRISPR system CMR subunit Cmr7 [Sulfurisphaera ohwakuensis]|uniref:Uncharacterized protein n=1 Tax=Sulfurisphaera ohwakuensis TaxID=69656 RepID=A0A650CJ01_SULOH|nr:type III-B CRISPR system CMR subunit Cmr7 [Sulfurisphaera ohwakuensis]MBB5253316.1 hypothetical protein [Sulfurisphaera ohwakuensis]QGR17645.1 hypothetical protein D1869_11000 [Sulfurisphaera ohwakuensis]